MSVDYIAACINIYWAKIQRQLSAPRHFFVLVKGELKFVPDLMVIQAWNIHKVSCQKSDLVLFEH